MSPTAAPLTLPVPSSLISFQIHSSTQASPYFPFSHRPATHPTFPLSAGLDRQP
ncbi:hypothetical protein Peur_059882 [Populus x canadensis]